MLVLWYYDFIKSSITNVVAGTTVKDNIIKCCNIDSLVLIAAIIWISPHVSSVFKFSR